MAATITWTDSVGAGTLTALGGRLNDWTPDPLPLDDAATRLGSGQVDTLELRERAQVRFKALVANSDLALALRLTRHLWRGGTVTVNTGDRTTPTPLSYGSMGIGTSWDGQRIAPELVRVDPATLDYELTLTVQYVGAAPVPDLVVLY